MNVLRSISASKSHRHTSLQSYLQSNRCAGRERFHPVLRGWTQPVKGSKKVSERSVGVIG
ncbi:alanine-glyoxylate transaminase [Moniliophthora roreri]|nr:alanine-glyoxylate transaminase [Moniliophthora roreri]